MGWVTRRPASTRSRLEQQRGPIPSEQILTDPAQRAIFPPEDHALRGRVFTVNIRAAYTADPTGTAGEIVDALLAVSPEFAEVWRRHEVDVTHHHDLKRYRHPELGELELYDRRLLVFSAQPGSPSDEKLQRLITTI